MVSNSWCQHRKIRRQRTEMCLWTERKTREILVSVVSRRWRVVEMLLLKVSEKQGSKATPRVGNDLLSSDQRGIKRNLSWQGACGASLVLLRTPPCQGWPWPGTQQGLVLGKHHVWFMASTKADVSPGWTLTARAQLRGTAIGAEVTSFLPLKGFGKAGNTLQLLCNLSRKRDPLCPFVLGTETGTRQLSTQRRWRLASVPRAAVCCPVVTDLSRASGPTCLWSHMAQTWLGCAAQNSIHSPR